MFEANERGEGAVAAAEAGSDGGDAVEVVELLEDGEGEEEAVVGGDEGSDGGGGEGLGYKARDFGVREGAVEVNGAGHGVGKLEGEDADGGGRGGDRGGGRRNMGFLLLAHLVNPGLGDHGGGVELGLGFGFKLGRFVGINGGKQLNK